MGKPYALWCLIAWIFLSLVQPLEAGPRLAIRNKSGSGKAGHQEPKVDPGLLPIQDVPGLPRILLIGDSISMGYTPPVRELLKGQANVHHPPVNCESTVRGLQGLADWLGSGKWDVIHFNFGLHDLKYVDEAGRMVPPAKGTRVSTAASYETNLRSLVANLKSTGAKLIWCSTTPIPEGANGRVKSSEIEFNRLAANIMEENGIAVDDLHSFAVEHQAEIQRPQNVHFTDEGSRKLAELVAASIRLQLASARKVEP
jgi:lysophospholipase L1-like esterase